MIVAIHLGALALFLIVCMFRSSWWSWFFCVPCCECGAGKSCEQCRKRWDSFQDMPTLKNGGLVLWCVALVLFILRRLSLWENIKHVFRSTKAWGLELYLLAWWIVVLSVPNWEAWLKSPPVCFRWIAVLAIVQIVQTNFYHQFWRTLGEGLSEKEIESRRVFNKHRNLIIGFANILLVNRLFGLFYWWSRESEPDISNFNEPFTEIGDAFYFSVVTGSTLGYGEFYPLKNADLIQQIVILQVVVSLFLVGVVLSQSVSAVRKLEQQQDIENPEVFENGGGI